MYRAIFLVFLAAFHLGAHAKEQDLEDIELVVNAGQPIEMMINDQPVSISPAPEKSNPPCAQTQNISVLYS